MTAIEAAAPTASTGGWLAAFRGYFLLVVPADLVWEIAHLPLYTIWQEPLARRAFAVFHCTLGDVLIATATLVVSLVLFGGSEWPLDGKLLRRVAGATILLGVGYTIYSEWLNISVRAGWTYSPYMPKLPWIGTGLSPILQWIVVPSLGFVAARRSALRATGSKTR